MLPEEISGAVQWLCPHETPAPSAPGTFEFMSFGLPSRAVDRAITPELLDQLEAALFQMLETGTPGLFEVEIPVTHTFTQHAYIREGIIPAGLLIIGHAHRYAHHCTLLSGRMSLLNPDRSWTQVAGPASFVGQPGRKIGFMHTHVLMQNIHPSAGWENALFEDTDTLEEFLYIRSPAFKAHQLKAAQTPPESLKEGVL